MFLENFKIKNILGIKKININDEIKIVKIIYSKFKLI